MGETMLKAIFVITVLASLLTGCATQPPVGNAKGGVIQWAFTNAQEVQAKADAHCAQFGKSGHITEMNSQAGGHVLFECV